MTNTAMNKGNSSIIVNAPRSRCRLVLPLKFMMRSGLTKKAEPPPTRDVNRDSGTDSANGGWLRRLVRPRYCHKSKITQASASLSLSQRTSSVCKFGTQKSRDQESYQRTASRACQAHTSRLSCCWLVWSASWSMRSSGLTKKAEPPPTCDVNRDSGTDRANGGWLRRLVRHQSHKTQ